MLRLEMARQRIERLDDLDSDLLQIRNTAQNNLNRCSSSLRRLRELDRSIPDLVGIAEKAIVASPGLYKTLSEENPVLSSTESNAVAQLAAKAVGELIQGISNAWQAREERGKYQGRYQDLRRTAKNDFTTIVEKRYSDVPQTDGSNCSVNLQGSLNAFFTADWLCLTNRSGKTLTNCTLLVLSLIHI